MLSTCLTATVIVIEVGIVGYNLHKQGVFKNLKKKFTKQVSNTVDNVTQPILKRISHA